MPDPFARPLPMQSLATEEDNWAWNKPPEYADYEEFVASTKKLKKILWICFLLALLLRML